MLRTFLFKKDIDMFKDFDSKYEPKTLNDILFHSAQARKTVEGLTNGFFGFPSSGVNGILLYGIYGSGKSALAKILPQLIEAANGGDTAHVSYFNVAQGGDNGATVIERIKTQAQLIPFSNAYHYFVLDEVDNLRADTMSSLKVAMNSKQSIFILTTNHLNKIEGGVLNRCEVVEFNAAASKDWLLKVKAILADYGITDIADNKLLDIIEPCEGSARKILSAIKKLIGEIHMKRAA
jgi:replication-associated recombination protein RarA